MLPDWCGCCPNSLNIVPNICRECAFCQTQGKCAERNVLCDTYTPHCLLLSEARSSLRPKGRNAICFHTVSASEHAARSKQNLHGSDYDQSPPRATHQGGRILTPYRRSLLFHWLKTARMNHKALHGPAPTRVAVPFSQVIPLSVSFMLYMRFQKTESNNQCHNFHLRLSSLR